jgi:hypothetical protein
VDFVVEKKWNTNVIKSEKAKKRKRHTIRISGKISTPRRRV